MRNARLREALYDPLKIIAIDDNLHLRTSLQILLASLGQHVQTAATGDEGIVLIRQAPVDLVICDLDLQGPVNGYAIARMVAKESTRHGTPYLAALSGNSQQEDRENSAVAGFDRHLGKPFNVQDLEELIAEVRRHRLRK